MSFPEHIAKILDSYGILAETKAALLDVYYQHGAAALEAFGDLAERFESVSEIKAGDLAPLKQMMILRHLTKNHREWMEGRPTESFFAPRLSEGRGTGLISPIGCIDENGKGFAANLARSVRQMIGPDQPMPDGMLVMGRNAHYGGRDNTVSFDVVVPDEEDAVQVGYAEGRQHTVPGSIGETSGSYDGTRKIALLWEIQPNVYKPAGDRNRKIAKVYRKHRNWHITTLAAAIQWLRSANTVTFVLKGEALAATHEVNWREPVTKAVIDLHDRTVARVVAGLGLTLRELSEDEIIEVGASGLMNTGLRKRFESEGASACLLVIDAKE
jgi:hypothetical protein